MNMLLAVLAGLAALALFVLGALFTFVTGSGLVVKAYFAAVFGAGLVAVWLRRRRAPAAEAPWPVRARRAMVSLCLVLAAGLGATFLASAAAIRPPKQADLASWLREHRAEFERMREIVQGGQFDAHGAEYWRLLRATGCQGANVWSDGSVSFGYRSLGMANQGWRATLVWSPKQPSPLLPTIDGFPATKVPGSDRAFSRLDGSWYAHIVW
jgi:hypothetical protein